MAAVSNVNKCLALMVDELFNNDMEQMLMETDEINILLIMLWLNLLIS